MPMGLVADAEDRMGFALQEGNIGGKCPAGVEHLDIDG